ncbi:MAG: CDP-glycerol glycerophosphotransferase family protein [Actinomycetota bacterium]|nr:CDP-glycerol glycerophosphotransferase family protein [Actinomycetota bacterium]
MTVRGVRAIGAAKLALLRLLMRVTPALRHAVVAGFPYDEGNSVEMVRALAARMPVYWLIGDSPAPVDWLLRDAHLRFPVRRLPKNSVRGYLAYITARYVFFTHGLYGSPHPPRHKTSVNLWHGDGPKRSKRFTDIRSTFAVAGTQLWGGQRPTYFDVAAEGVLVTGNPRVDQFARPAGDETMRALGLDPQRALVLWMPTFRRTDYRGARLGVVRNQIDAEELSRSQSVRELLEQVGQVARRLGVTLAVKPHPLDADRYAAMGLSVILADDLRSVRTTAYQLLGRSHGLITDYSSVWTDYLAMNRPVGFHCPDIEQYEADPGLNVEGYRELIPGPLLHTVADFERFLRDCLDESTDSKQRRARSTELIGAETRSGVSDRLLDALGIQRPPQPATVAAVAG